MLCRKYLFYKSETNMKIDVRFPVFQILKIKVLEGCRRFPGLGNLRIDYETQRSRRRVEGTSV